MTGGAGWMLRWGDVIVMPVVGDMIRLFNESSAGGDRLQMEHRGPGGIVLTTRPLSLLLALDEARKGATD